MKVSKLMSTRMVSVSMEVPLSQVLKLFEQHRFHHLLVVDELKLVGVISDRDVLKTMNANTGSIFASVKDDACLKKPAHQIMSRYPVVIASEDSVIHAVHLFNQHKISMLPVVDERGYPVDILSWRDIFRGIERAYGKA